MAVSDVLPDVLPCADVSERDVDVSVGSVTVLVCGVVVVSQSSVVSSLVVALVDISVLSETVVVVSRSGDVVLVSVVLGVELSIVGVVELFVVVVVDACDRLDVTVRSGVVGVKGLDVSSLECGVDVDSLCVLSVSEVVSVMWLLGVTELDGSE